MYKLLKKKFLAFIYILFSNNENIYIYNKYLYTYLNNKKLKIKIN